MGWSPLLAGCPGATTAAHWRMAPSLTARGSATWTMWSMFFWQQRISINSPRKHGILCIFLLYEEITGFAEVRFLNQHSLISAEVGKSKYIRIYNKPGCLVVRKKRQSCFSEEISESKMTMHRKETTKEMHFILYIYHFIITVYVPSPWLGSFIQLPKFLRWLVDTNQGLLYTVKRGKRRDETSEEVK